MRQVSIEIHPKRQGIHDASKRFHDVLDGDGDGSGDDVEEGDGDDGGGDGDGLTIILCNCFPFWTNLAACTSTFYLPPSTFY